MSEYNPPSIEACLDKPADAPMPDRRARGMVSSDKMMYWHERAMRAESALREAIAVIEDNHAARGICPDDEHERMRNWERVAAGDTGSEHVD